MPGITTRKRVPARQQRQRRMAFEWLEFRRLLAQLTTTMDFEVSGASQFGGGQAVYEDELFLGVENFDTGNFNVDLWLDEFDAGAKVSFGLSGKAGLNLGYYVNAGSIDLVYDDVTLRTNYEDATSLIDQVTIDPNVEYSAGGQNQFTTQSPTVGAYVDLVLQAATRGSLTGRLPFPLQEVGGTVSLNQNLINVNQELLSFNRDGSNQLRLLGEDILAGGVEINLPVSAAPPTSITLAAAQLEDEQGNALLGVEAAATLTVAKLADQIGPKSVKKSPDNASTNTLKQRARQLANSPLSVELATMQLNVPQINLSGEMTGAGIMTASNAGQRELENLIAALNLNLGLKDLTFAIGPASIAITPFNFQISPSLYATQTITVTPVNTIIYRFNHSVTGQVLNDSGSVVRGFTGRVVEIDSSQKLSLNFAGRPIAVSSEWNFKAQVDNQLTLNTLLGGSLTLGDLYIDASVPQWIKSIVGLPFDPRPLYQNKNIVNADLGSMIIDVGTFSILDQTVPLGSFRIGDAVQGSLLVNTTNDDLSNNSINSLREAIVYANAMNTVAEQVIQLEKGRYGLSRSNGATDASRGDLDVDARNLRIIGQGKSHTTIDANQIDRVFQVNPSAKLTLQDLTITGGNVPAQGGGVFAAGTVHLINVNIVNNTALEGGGVAFRGEGTIERSEISRNTASIRGGGILIDRQRDDGIVNHIQSSTIAANFSDVGGGVYARGKAQFTSSTISRNSTSGSSGTAIFSDQSDVSLLGSTVSANFDTGTGDSTAVFMNPLLPHTALTLTIRNTIIAGNSALDVGPDSAGAPFWFSIREDNTKNIIGSTNIIGWSSETLRGSPGNPLDPKLSILAYFGGDMRVHVPQTDSPARGGGTGMYRDQRGPFSFETNGSSDIGATRSFDRISIQPEFAHELPIALQIFSGQGGSATIELQSGRYALSEVVDYSTPLLVQSLGIANAMPLELTIVGEGASSTIIDGLGFNRGLFVVNQNATLNLDGLTLTNARTGEGGGAISVNSGTLNTEDVVFRGNSASTVGGAIFATGSVTLRRTSFEGNSAGIGGGAVYFRGGTSESLLIDGGGFKNNRVAGGFLAPHGGAVWISTGNATIVDSTFVGNQVGDATRSDMAEPFSARGGAIDIASGGNLLVERSSIIDNAAFGQSTNEGNGGDAYGGGISATGVLAVRNSTIVGNIARGGRGGSTSNGGKAFGGGIHVEGNNAFVTVISSTLVGNDVQTNHADTNLSELFGGGGMSVVNSLFAPTIYSTVIAENSTGQQEYSSYSAFTRRDVVGAFTSQGHNFIGVADEEAGFIRLTDRFGRVSDLAPEIGADLSQYSLDPMLGPLALAGSSTPVLVPLPNSPLIDAGASITPADQRGLPRTIGPQPDIGAVESDVLFVSTTEDVLGQRSLRQAFIDANMLETRANGIDIVLPAGVFVLDRQGTDNTNQLGDLDVLQGTKVRIRGEGAGLSVIDASGLNDKAFDIELNGELTLEGVTVIGSTFHPANHLARSIANFGTLVVRDSHFTGARTGAAIRNGFSGTLTIERSSFTDNQNASGLGGAIRNDGNMTVRTSTFANNLAAQGAAIYQVSGTSLFERVTVSGNAVTQGTAGIHRGGGTIALRQSIVANNSGPVADISGAFTSLGHNLIGNSLSASGFVGTDQLNVDPLLGEVALESPLPYFTLQWTSPALDAGIDVTGVATDQLGRPARMGPMADIGAVEQLILHVDRTDDAMVPGTLRYASTMANDHPGTDTISFAQLPGPIVLNGEAVQIDDSVELLGHHSGETIIDAADQSRGFEIGSETQSVGMRQLTIRGGRAVASGPANESGNGGGIFVEAPHTQLILKDSQIVDNSAQGVGGGLYSPGSVELDGSTFAGNTAQRGGGIYLEGSAAAGAGVLQARNSTFAYNQAGMSGGAIALSNTQATLEFTTIAENQAEEEGGGIDVGPDGAVTIQNSIVARNVANQSAPDIGVAERTELQVRHSLIGDNAGNQLPESPVGSNDPYGNIVGSSAGAGAIDPLLGALQDNGGAAPTMTPQSDSAAIGAAEEGSDEEQDQRGLRRELNSADMGAVEVQKIQNVPIAPTTLVDVLPIAGNRKRISFSYQGQGYSEVFATPEVQLNLLPWAADIPPQQMLEGSPLRLIPLEVGDYELSQAGELDSLEITASSSHPEIIPHENILISGSGSQRFLTINPTTQTITANESVTITLTLYDGVGTSTVAFPVTVLAALDIHLSEAQSNSIRIVRNGDSVEVRDGTNRETLVTAPLASTNAMRVFGNANVVDWVEIDYAGGGFFAFPYGMHIDGGSGLADELTIVGTGETQAVYSMTMVPAGQPQLEIKEQSASTMVRYTNVDHLRLDSFAAFDPQSSLLIGGGSLELDVLSGVTLPGLTELGGGRLAVTSELSLPAHARLVGHGQVNADWSAAIDSRLELTGDLQFGTATASHEFEGLGEIMLGSQQLAIFDANVAHLSGEVTTELSDRMGKILTSNELELGLQASLTVSLADSIVPSSGDAFQFISAGGEVNGAFASSSLPVPPLGTGWHVDYAAQAIELQLHELAQVDEVVLGNGINTQQRSEVNRIEVVFRGEVDIDDGAFQLRRRGDQGGIIATELSTFVDLSGNTVAVLSNFSGDFTRGGDRRALVDGNYDLTVDAAGVRRAGTQLELDGDGDGIGGGDYQFGTQAADRFFAFYGDTDGDRDVDGQDLGRFGLTFRKRAGQTGFEPALDFDGDGDVDGRDLAQFGSRFRGRLRFE